MKIIAKKADYYDSVQALGLDESIVFVRRESEFSELSVREGIGLSPSNRNFSEALMRKIALNEVDGAGSRRRVPVRQYRMTGMGFETEFFVVGFCGQFYPCVRIQKTIWKSASLFGEKPDTKVACFFPGDKIEIPKEFLQSDSKASSSLWVRKVDKFLKKPFKSGDEIFHYFKSPIVAFNITDFYSDKEIDVRAVVNPLLSEFKFFRVKDAYSAFQEIAQYLSGVLGNLNEDIVSIADKDMRNAKGFDDWSFKKRPTKHKS